MQRIGNDIVDLTDCHNTGKSRNTRFINRVFTPGEQERILTATDPDTLLWSLWAGKETAYKIIRKRYPSVSSVPRLYEVTLYNEEGFERSVDCAPRISFRSGFVDTLYERIYIRVFTTREYVHCVGATTSPEAIDSIIWQIHSIAPDSRNSADYASLQVRKALIQQLSQHMHVSPEHVTIQREQGPEGLSPPYVYIHGRRAEIDISLSHDGLFTAYAFCF